MKFNIKQNKFNFKTKYAVIKEYPDLENIEITPSKEEQTFKSKDYYGYNEVKVNGVTNEIDNNIAPENIKQGINILGVTGNVEEINTTEISINPSDTEKVVTPEAPYNGFSKVTVGAQSGIDPAEYFNGNYTSVNTTGRTAGGWRYAIKRLPSLTIPSNTTNLDYFFAGFTGTTVPLIDTSNATSMYQMFSYCEELTTVPLFDTSNVKNMYQMFYYCYDLGTVPLFDTSNVTNMQEMFYYCQNLTSIPQFDFSNVTNMSNMFYYCYALKSLPTLDLPQVTNMKSAFYYANKLETVGDINSPLLTNAQGMFNYAFALKSLGEIDGSSLTNVSTMLAGTKTYFTDFGGIKDLGKAYSTTQAENYSNYTLSLSFASNLSHDSLMNVINKLYDIASKGVKPQKLVLGANNLARLTADEISIAQNKGWSVS